VHPLPADADPELLRGFAEETAELLARVDPLVAALNAPELDPELLPSLMRELHTVKGTASFLGLPHLVTLAHELEGACGGIHEGRILRSAQMARQLRSGFDLLAALVRALVVALDREEPMAIPAGYRSLVETLLSTPPSVPVLKVPEPIGHAQLPGESFADMTLRVPTHRMDEMLGRIDRLAALQRRLEEAADRWSGPDAEVLREMGATLAQLQQQAQAVRMVPFYGTFRKLGRLARDTATYLAKAVDFRTEGGAVEVDRYVMEQIGDPLLHMVRNAIDHGIELVADRLLAGKPEAGTVWLTAALEGDTLVLVLRDDGQGLQRDRLLAEARRRGLVGPDAVLPDAEAHGLIFSPGFTTASHLTTLSGRGVGMDVVRQRIQGLRGQIAVASTPGEGTTFTIRIPSALSQGAH
jgi:two-component system chemotaxis sensor kinase CheA